jgi:hypothetical protein
MKMSIEQECYKLAEDCIDIAIPAPGKGVERIARLLVSFYNKGRQDEKMEQEQFQKAMEIARYNNK